MGKWYARFRDISRYINPKRGFFEGFVPNYNAQIDYKLVMDADIAHYASVMAAGMSSGLTSRTRPWFRLGLEDQKFEDDEEVKDWLQTSERVLYRMFAGSNIYDAFFQAYEELGMFGTGSFAILEDYHTIMRAMSFTIGEYYLGCDHSGRVNAFARQYWKTTDQLVYEFGWNNVSDLVKRAYNANQHDVYFLVYELCEENKSKIDGYKNFSGMRWRSIKWEATSPFYKKALEVKGYNEFPFMCPRWDLTTTADTYGTGPGWKRLGDIKMVYAMEKDLIMAINKVADPPVQVNAAVEGTVNLVPGGITRFSQSVPDAGVKPAYQVNPDIQHTDAYIDKRKSQIASEFFADLFMMMLNQPEGKGEKDTAREVAEKHDEKMLMLGPVLGRIQSDMLDPTIDRAFQMAIRAQIIPPPPRQIMGQQIKTEYISILAQAQRMVETAPIEQAFVFAGTLAGAYPEAKDILDPDEGMRQYTDALGVRGKIVRDKRVVEQLRAARAKQQQAEKDTALAMAATEGAKNLAGAKVGGGNALEHLMGIAPSGAPPA